MHTSDPFTAAGIAYVAILKLTPYARNARTHSKKQIKQIAKSIERFGFANPELISDDGQIIAGHGRVEVAKLLGMDKVPTLALSHLSLAERQAYILAENAGWDREMLAIELQHLIDLDFDVELTGFDIAEIDFIIEEAQSASGSASDPRDDAVPEADGSVITKAGDIWQMGKHRLICGDAVDYR